MPTSTYIPLANLTLGSSAASVTFSSISQAYRDLILVIDGSRNNQTDRGGIRFNSDTASTYSDVVMQGNGSSTFSGTQSASYISIDNAPGSTLSLNSIVQIMDYSATDKHKTVLVRNNKVSSQTSAWAGRWASTSAITSLIVMNATGGDSWATGTTLTLYGIAS